MSATTFATVRKKLFAGHAVPIRECRVCGQEIAYVLSPDRTPIVRSCQCRERGQSRLIDLTWAQFQSLVEHHG